MAESQTKPDTAAEKSPAEASLKAAGSKAGKDASIDLKAVEMAVEADAPAPAKTAPAKTAPAKATKVAKAVAAKNKPVSKTTTSKTTQKKKARASKPASQRPALVKKPAQPRSTPITKRKDTVMATANTITTDFAATAKDAAAEMQTRAKAAYEKGTVLTGEMTEFHKGNLEAIVESGKLLAGGMQNMGRTYMEDARTAADTVTEDVKKMAAIKSPTELFQLQGEIARRNFDAAVAQTSKNTETMMKLFTEAFAPLSNRASVAAEKVSKAAA